MDQTPQPETPAAASRGADTAKSDGEPEKLAHAAYRNTLYEFLKRFENPNAIPGVHASPSGVPAIGLGYELLVEVTVVTNGRVKTASTIYAPRTRGEIDRHLTAAYGKPFAITDKQYDLLADLADLINGKKPKTSTGAPNISDLDLEKLDSAAMRRLFDVAIVKFEEEVDKLLTDAAGERFTEAQKAGAPIQGTVAGYKARTLERWRNTGAYMALVSQRYNAIRPTKAAGALVNDDIPEAFVEIAYRSNSKGSTGLAARRSEEALLLIRSFSDQALARYKDQFEAIRANRWEMSTFSKYEEKFAALIAPGARLRDVAKKAGATVAERPNDTRIAVQPDDTLIGIANSFRERTGDTRDTAAIIRKIQELNPSIKGPKDLRAGEVIVLPDPLTEATSAPAAAPDAADAPAARPADPAEDAASYTVRQGDTLSDIAARHRRESGDARALSDIIADIMAHNGIRDPRRLQIGRELVLPPPPTPAANPDAAPAAPDVPGEGGALEVDEDAIRRAAHRGPEGDRAAALRRALADDRDPAEDIVLKPVEAITENEFKQMIASPGYWWDGHPLHRDLQAKRGAWAERFFSAGAAPAPHAARAARSAEGIDLGRALTRLSGAMAAMEDAIPEATVPRLQAGLNRLAPAQAPLRVDGVLGPHTRMRTKQALARHGLGTLERALRGPPVRRTG